MSSGGQAGGGTGLLASLRRLGGTLVAMAHTRLELLATEGEEQLVRVARLAVFAASALLLLTLGVLLATVFVLILFWDTHRLAAAGVLALAYLAGGIACALRVRHEGRMRPKLFAATLAELRKDKDQLKGGS